MAITDKTRKVLWARSGNLCAFCRRRLVVEATGMDETSVVGEECHIISGRPTGPRASAGSAGEPVDDLPNLILLCATHHKMIDDQADTYGVKELRSLKAKHEAWVAATLDASSPRPVRVRRSAPAPIHLVRVSTGVALFRILEHADASKADYDEPRNETDAELVGAFLQNVKDWIDIAGDLEPVSKVRAAESLASEIRDLERAGLWVFAGIEPHVLEGGTRPASPFNVAIVRVVYSDSPEILGIDASASESAKKSKA